MDGKKKRFALNALDMLIILTVIAFAVGYVIKANVVSRLGIGYTSRDVEMTVRLEHERPIKLDYLKVGDTVWNTDTDKKIGTIKKIETKNAEYFIDLIDGGFGYDETDVRVDLSVTIETKGKEDEEGVFLLGTRHVSKGSSFNFFTELTVCYGTVIDVKVLTE